MNEAQDAQGAARRRHCTRRARSRRSAAPPAAPDPSAPHAMDALAQEGEVAPVIVPYWERAEFPFELVPGFQASRGGRACGLLGGLLGAGAGASTCEPCALHPAARMPARPRLHAPTRTAPTQPPPPPPRRSWASAAGR